MTPLQVETDRATLYEEVWTTPVSRLAERYGISDVALKKVCRRMNVPTPPRGYWARVRHGHTVQKPPLPPPGRGTPETHTFYPNPASEPEPGRPGPKPEIPAPLRSVADKVVVADALRNPDPFVVQTRDALKERLKTWRPEHRVYARLSPGETGTINVDVCPSSIPRALRLLDAVLKGARRAGFEVSAGRRGSERDVHFVIEGEEVPFLLREPMRQERVELPKEKRYGSRYEFKYHPTGRLTLELANKWYVPRHTWRDTERQRLEDLVGVFLIGAYRAATAYRERRLETERRRREERLRAEKERRLERLRAAEAERRRELEAQAERWRRSREVAAFVDEVERRAGKTSMTEEEREALDAWLAWARDHVKRLDPFDGGVAPPLPLRAGGVLRPHELAAADPPAYQ